MQTEPGAGEPSFLEELIQAEPQHPTKKSKDAFRPWHKPRKHWIRRNQWQAEALNLIGELGLAQKQRPLSYVSLPGPDLLDVRSMHQVCLENGVKLQFLGFMTGTKDDETELNLSYDEVMSLPNVVRESSVVVDAIQSLADRSSVGFSRIEGSTSFDVINIDLCNSIAGAAPESDRAYYDALQQLIDSQRRRRPPNEPWILFLTTRANSGAINQQAKERFLDCLLANVRDHEDVRQAILEALDLSEQAIGDFRNAGAAAPGFEKAFTVAVSKWLLQLMGTGAPTGTIELLPSSCVYGVSQPGGMDMLSLGFLFRTNVAPPVDGAGLAAAPQNAHPIPSEPEAACNVIRRVPEMKNVDEVLRSDPGTYDAVAADAAEFMRYARFDYDKYMEQAAKWPEAPVRNAAAV